MYQRQDDSHGLRLRVPRWAGEGAIVVGLAVIGGLSSIALGRGGPALCKMMALPGGLQWLAGIHVLPLIVAAGLVRRPGAATMAGVLKGAVELMAGSSHAGLVIAYAGMAGMVVDLVFLIGAWRLGAWGGRRPGRSPAATWASPAVCLVAGGLGTASNILVQACSAGWAGACPATMSYLTVAAIALVSGVVLAGWPGWVMVRALRRLWGVKYAGMARGVS